MFAIATFIRSNKDVDLALGLGFSIRVFSYAKSICLVSSSINIDKKELLDRFDYVIDVPVIHKDINMSKWYILGIEDFDYIMFLEPSFMLNERIDYLFNIGSPSCYFPSVYGSYKNGDTIASDLISIIDDRNNVMYGPLIIKPHKMTYELFKVDMNSLYSGDYNHPEYRVLMLFYPKYGYNWKYMDTVHNSSILNMAQYLSDLSGKGIDKSKENKLVSQWKLMRSGLYVYMPEKHHKLYDHMIKILKPILGSQIITVLNKTFPYYEQCFISKDINKTSNYDLFEFYGDKFLGGFFSWILIRTPGIISSEQATIIGNYFQDKDRLEEIFDKLNLFPYLSIQGKENYSGSLVYPKYVSKSKSDVIEALIGCIGITWDIVFKKGDWAMRTFVEHIYENILGYEIDVEGYESKYTNPYDRLIKKAELLFIDRSQIATSKPVTQNNKVMVNVLYGSHVIGTGEATLEKNKYTKDAIKEATKNAYQNVMDMQSLEKIASKQ